jgi:hypothetical protein
MSKKYAGNIIYKKTNNVSERKVQQVEKVNNGVAKGSVS